MLAIYIMDMNSIKMLMNNEIQISPDKIPSQKRKTYNKNLSSPLNEMLAIGHQYSVINDLKIYNCMI
jgi:hypothetical protein